MAISRYAAVTDAILSMLTADATLTAVPAQVVDGPPTGQVYRDVVVYVGYGGDDDDETAGNISQNYRTAGIDASRDEIVSINCVAECVRGDNNLALARTSATAALGAIETALRGNVSLGVSDVAWIEVTDATVIQFRDSDGCTVRHLFTITATSVI